MSDEQKSEAQELQELLGSLDFESRTLFAEAAIGEEAREFLQSDLGRAMVGFAQQDYADAMQRLKSTSPWRRWRIAQLQNEARQAERFPFYLRDLLIRGKSAEKTLQQREES